MRPRGEKARSAPLTLESWILSSLKLFLRVVGVSGLLAHLAGVVKGLLFPKPEAQKKYGIRALAIEINGHEITVIGVIPLK